MITCVPKKSVKNTSYLCYTELEKWLVFKKMSDKISLSIAPPDKGTKEDYTDDYYFATLVEEFDTESDFRKNL